MRRKGRKLWAVIAVVLGCGLGSTLAIPFLVLGVGGIGRSNGESCSLTSPGPAAPTILGDSQLTAVQLTDWWSSTERDQPTDLEVVVADLVADYLQEGGDEGIRGDVAFAQAVHETGYFKSPDTAINNFAGIGHSDDEASGRAFDDAATGVRAHIQLLKKFAVGNDATLAHPDVAPDAGARASTWAELAGRWASDPSYWTAVSLLYGEMRASATGRPVGTPGTDICEATAEQPEDVAAVGSPSLTTVRGITVDSSIAALLDDMLAAAQADGLLLSGDGYRSHERQIELRRAHCGPSTYQIYEAPASACSPPTARPGTSKHEVGLAIDFANCSERSTACWQWLDAHAATYGFFNLPGEPWHWSVDGS